MDRDGHKPQASAISIKGVVVRGGRVLLLRNERNEWELPGGRIEIGETPEECVVREIYEETRWKVVTGPILDAWMYHIDVAEKHVFIVTYGCIPAESVEPILSHEHKEVGLFDEREIVALVMPDGYNGQLRPGSDCCVRAQNSPDSHNDRQSLRHV